MSLLETFDRLERNDGTSALELGMYCAFFVIFCSECQTNSSISKS